MTPDLTYKGYRAIISYDDEDAVLVGCIAELRDGVGFHAESIGGLRSAFREAVDDYLETCAKIGKQPRNQS